jgi:hypothetical protein
MRIVVATHGHCFDGLASAVVFTRLARSVEGGEPTFSYRGCGYGDGQLTPTDSVLTGDQNAILDYRFAASDRLTWYFDHHRTAFLTPADRAYFDARVSSGKFFFDPDFTSCTKFLAGIARTRFGVEVDDLAEMIRWADVIDSAAFESPELALDRRNPVLRLAAVVERHGDDPLLSRLVPELLTRSLAEVVQSSDIDRRYKKIEAQHERFVKRVKERAVLHGQVVLVDLTNEPVETIGKFVTYALYPEAVYSVIVGQLKNASKISVGYNPWSGKPCGFDISAICARYGGGGHAVVGAVQLKPDEIARAREIALTITRELSG